MTECNFTTKRDRQIINVLPEDASFVIDTLRTMTAENSKQADMRRRSIEILRGEG